jgi:hypothetical protein
MTNPFGTTDDIRYDDQQSVLVIGADAGTRDAARTAVDHADMRLIDAIGFEDAVARLTASANPDVIVVEIANAAPDLADTTLAAIDTIARERDIDVVVAMTDDQVDLVAARLFGRHAHLLCGPSVTERVAALRWAGGLRGHRLHDSARDTDERLRRLNAEVARFAETLSLLTAERDQPRIAQIRDTGPGFRAEPAGEPLTATRATDVRDVIRARRMRAAHFPDDLFADPAWDMLLDLFAAELEHRRVSVSSLCIAAAVPGTTALRWIGSMIEARLFDRYADPNDRRRAFISLSATARAGMQQYFHAVRRAGLSPA